jgi:hypothetical protein
MCQFQLRRGSCCIDFYLVVSAYALPRARSSYFPINAFRVRLRVQMSTLSRVVVVHSSSLFVENEAQLCMTEEKHDAGQYSRPKFSGCTGGKMLFLLRCACGEMRTCSCQRKKLSAWSLHKRTINLASRLQPHSTPALLPPVLAPKICFCAHSTRQTRPTSSFFLLNLCRAEKLFIHLDRNRFSVSSGRRAAPAPCKTTRCAR